VVTDIYWIFMRHAATWQELRRADDVGKWILLLAADETALLRHASAAIPLLAERSTRLVKFTNLSTPRSAERKDTAVILAYCRDGERDALRARLEPHWGASLAWKTNRETFSNK
jgi:hypothetical protein